MELSHLRGIVMTVLALASLSACSGGDGVPTATIANGLDTCIVEASFLGYGFMSPIGPTGRMAAREIVEGEDVAFAVTMTPQGSEKCVDLARKTGGELWATKLAHRAEAGKLTEIRFDTDSAFQIEAACTPQYVEGLKRFGRLHNPCE